MIKNNLKVDITRNILEGKQYKIHAKKMYFVQASRKNYITHVENGLKNKVLRSTCLHISSILLPDLSK